VQNFAVNAAARLGLAFVRIAVLITNPVPNSVVNAEAGSINPVKPVLPVNCLYQCIKAEQYNNHCFLCLKNRPKSKGRLNHFIFHS
jgi:hypothetical protein